MNQRAPAHLVRHPAEFAAGPTRRARLATAVLLTTMLAGLSGCSAGEPESAAASAEPDAAADAGSSPISVATATTAMSHGTLDAAAVLQLDETRTARIGSIVDAVVVELRAKVGDRVAQGAVLGTLHSHRLHDAQADYRKARAEQRQRQTELTFATDAESRAERLLAAKAVSPQDVSRARADRIAAAETLVVADSEVRRSGDELEHLGVALDDLDRGAAEAERIPIRAPFAGIVLERHVAPGQAVTPGTPLFVVSDLTDLWAVAEVDETHLSKLTAGQAATVRVGAYPDTSFPGRILAVGDAVHESTRRISVRVGVPNRDGRLKPQMFASVQLGVGEEREVVVVPAAALQTVGDRSVVFVEGQNGTFEERQVTVGVERGERAEVHGGLRAGERVATTGSFLLKSARTADAEEQGAP